MAPDLHYETPEKDRVPLTEKVIYGLGAFVNNILAAAIGGMSIVLNLGLGMNPALVGLLGALPRLIDAFTDPLMGYISDQTRSRWGRRRPYIFAGAILVSISFALLWQLPEGKSQDYYFWFFLIGSLVFYLFYTMFATPWVALGYELTPDYHERTRVMAVQNFMGQLAYLISPWFLWIMQHEGMFDNLASGAAGLAVAIAIAVTILGVLPAIFLRERYQDLATKEIEEATAGVSGLASQFRERTLDFFRGFAMTLRFSPFMKLCAATFLVFNGFMMVASFQSYIIIYYVFAGDQELGAEYAGWSGTVSAFGTFFVIFFISWLSTLIGKRRAFFVAIGVSMLGYALKWICYDPRYPLLLLLPAPLIAFGLGGLFTLMGSMIADVCDMDELQSHERREGMFGSIYWWVVKLGMAAALAIGGVLLNATGFDVALGGHQTEQALLLMRLFDIVVPLVFSGIAIWLIASYPITEQVAAEVRQSLEARRGSVS
ncbi:MFS transporter [Seongchinamella unica]|uniref:MFS transporter n=1 Tax=Seongchinamella unica TaxID=2547392 RepID=A0A4R5LUZ9_9GAMM|nr:MFS transporter [Seongchinamella unica]TDG15202.1 MFS transporter [Seongchinamella unica]